MASLLPAKESSEHARWTVALKSPSSNFIDILWLNDSKDSWGVSPFLLEGFLAHLEDQLVGKREHHIDNKEDGLDSEMWDVGKIQCNDLNRTMSSNQSYGHVLKTWKYVS